MYLDLNTNDYKSKASLDEKLNTFLTKRYITVDGKPLFAIWNPGDHPEEISLLIKTWKKLAEKEGLKGIHFVGQTSISRPIDVLLKMGFDAVYENRQNQALNNGESWSISHRINNLFNKVCGKKLFLDKHDFGKCYHLLKTERSKQQNVYPTLLAGYDRSPRAGRNAQIFFNFTPENWRKHIRDVLSLIRDKDVEHNVVILKSWNEWGESNYIEPDIKYGTAMLDILGEELKDV